MGTRLELQNKLEELLGSRHVYFQPPESVKMEYPAIKYSMTGIKKTKLITQLTYLPKNTAW